MANWVFLLGVVIELVSGTSATMEPRPGVTAANVQRIQTGMKVAEVKAILGSDMRLSSGGGTQHSSDWNCYWVGTDGIAYVTFGCSPGVPSLSPHPSATVENTRFVPTP